MIDLYPKIREWLDGHGHSGMPPECIMAARDAIRAGESLDTHLARRGLTNREHYNYAALTEAVVEIGSRK